VNFHSLYLYNVCLDIFGETCYQIGNVGARRRRNGGVPGGGCAMQARRHSPRLLVVGDGNPMAVQGLARLGARRGENRQM
jgi:hypothetical protein